MKITENFIEKILMNRYPSDYEMVYESSPLIQYLDKKMKAVHGNTKTRRSLANIYAIYSITYFYVRDKFCDNKEKYKKFLGYDYTKLFCFYRKLYGGSKLQNHGLNNRAIGEFKNKTHTDKDLFVINDGKYLIHIDYLYSNGHDIAQVVNLIIEEYIKLLTEKDNFLLTILKELEKISAYDLKRNKLIKLLSEDAEARIFEIISYAILKNHFKNEKVYFGYTLDSVKEISLELYKTGRTNANDGGIDFVMRPVGRFFQVTEVGIYDKYLLDIKKVMHFPITFVIKTELIKEEVMKNLSEYIEEQSGGMELLKTRYLETIEEIITINELKAWIFELNNNDIDNIIRDIDVYFKLEMNMGENYDVDETEE